MKKGGEKMTYQELAKSYHIRVDEVRLLAHLIKKPYHRKLTKDEQVELIKALDTIAAGEEIYISERKIK